MTMKELEQKVDGLTQKLEALMQLPALLERMLIRLDQLHLQEPPPLLQPHLENTQPPQPIQPFHENIQQCHENIQNQHVKVQVQGRTNCIDLPTVVITKQSTVVADHTILEPTKTTPKNSTKIFCYYNFFLVWTNFIRRNLFIIHRTSKLVFYGILF